MGKVIVVANQKGGVGKTTTSQALVAGLAKKGYRTLGVDLDPQGNLSVACGVSNCNISTVYEMMKGIATADDVIQSVGSYDIVPADITLAGAEQELSSTGKEYKLKEGLISVVGKYDYIIIDAPPSLGVLTINAFTFADEIIIPTTAGLFSTIGINQLVDTVRIVQKYCNQNVKIKGILFTRFNPRTNIGRQIKELTENLVEYIEVPIYSTYIRSGVIVDEAQAKRKDIFTYSSKSTVAEDYRAFIEEYLKGA